jgi:Fe-S cluster assembly scaffold protein SufB
MRSRGIPEKEAMVLQMISFISPVIEHIADPELKEKISSSVEKAIREMV